MKTLLNTLTPCVLSTILATSLAGCGGGGGNGASSDSVTASLVDSKPVTVTTSTSAGSASDAASVTTPIATTTPDVAAPAASNSGAAAGTDAVATTSVSSAAVTAPVTTPVTTPVTPSASATPVTTPAAPVSTPATTPAFGTYLRPYAATSLWNSRPVNPVFGTFVIPKSSYYPAVQSGAYSTGVFLASATDQPMTVVGNGSTDTTTVGVSDPDTAGSRVITIPRWPAGVLPASGSDGHADIVDPVTNIIHSFWQLKQVNGRWTAALYSWSNLNGTGWGDPAHYYTGARAVGIPASAGLIRKQEINDGLPTYTHALAMSLTYNALGNGTTTPAYVFPATSADNSASSNTGAIPEGALLMLPPTFDSSGIVNPDLKKVVETLKLYGAYVVDRNTGTPYVIYVENDSGFNLMPKGWDNTIASQLDLIRANLRQVVSAPNWVDSSGNSTTAAITAQKMANIMSMRGPWYKQSGTATASYDTYSQSLSFSATTTKTIVSNANNNGLTHLNWATPKTGSYVTFSVSATGGAKLRLQLTSTGTRVYDSWDLGDGQSVQVQWPAYGNIVLTATSGTSGVSSVKGSIVPVQ